jgi:choline kinase
MKVIRDGDRLIRVGKKLPLDRVDAESIGMMTFRGEGPRLFREAIDRTMRTPDALKQWYLSLIDTLAERGVVYTQQISSQGWAEVDSVADLERASAPGSPWLATSAHRSIPA